MTLQGSSGARTTVLLLATLAVCGLPGAAQTPSQPSQTEPAAPAPASPPEHHGKVLFQSHGEPPEPAADGVQDGLNRRRLEPPVPEDKSPDKQMPDRKAPDTAIPDVADREREAFTISRYDLDLRVNPAKSTMAVRARIVVRNDAKEALRLLPLEISSTLHWDSATALQTGGGRTSLALVQHALETDADHTGAAAEALVTLPEPLLPGQSVELDVLYSGTLPPSTGRLQRIGVSAEKAAGVDWDGVGGAAGLTALRGFGNVLWYPVVSPQLFLGSGNELFRAVGAARLRGRSTAAKLHLAVEYVGEPPAAVYFCGRRQPLRALADATDVPVAAGTGIAIADFAEAPIGFRVPSLFVIDQAETLIAPPGAGTQAAPAEPAFSSSTGATGIAGAAVSAERASAPQPVSGGSNTLAGDPLLAVETTDEAALPALEASAQRVAPLLVEWFGPRPLSSLTVLDADGQPFQDGPLLRASIAKLGSSGAAGVLVQSLTAAWVQTGVPWVDEGLGEFMGLLWTEQNAGRPAALAQLGDSMTAVALAEPGFERPAAPENIAPGPTASGHTAPGQQPAASNLPTTPDAIPAPPSTGTVTGEPLISAQSELFYRRKAAAVWWMLREIVGEDALRQALTAWRLQPASGSDAAAQAAALQKLLERTSGKQLGWFFDDWVMRDRGLPDLTLVDVTPRQLPAGQGHDSGWLVAVTVRNDGAAVAEVPLVVRSGTFSVTRRLRVPGFSSVTDRVLVEAAPTEVLVNDGSVPELRTAIHSRTIVTHAQ